MGDGRWPRLALEAGFLVAVAAVLAYLEPRPVWIVLAMALAWAIVALLEWAAWHEHPHWASGLPPRYYVPEQPLPPRPVSVELPAFTTYPRRPPREPEAPTWIATPAMRAEMLGWPAPPPEATEEPQTTVEELPEGLLAEVAAGREAADELDVGWPVAEPAADPWIAEEPPAEPEPAVVAAEPPEPEPEPEPEPVEAGPAPPTPTVGRSARHHLDPFAAAAARRRRWQRTLEAQDAVVEVAALPPRPAFPLGEAATRGGER